MIDKTKVRRLKEKVKKRHASLVNEPYIEIDSDTSYLDGDFTAEELRIIANIMEE